MAQAPGQDKFIYSILEMEPQITSGNGSWTFSTSGNVPSFNKQAAADTTTTLHPISRRYFPLGPSGALALAKASVLFTVGTAGLSSAPTAVLDQVTINATTRAVTRAAAVQTLAFVGTDTVGTSTGNYSAEVSITTPILLPPTDYYVLELTWVAAATSVLKIFGLELAFQG
jgi:hypothetical protein